MAWPVLKIGDFTIPIPIIQGGMGIGVSLSNLAAAVINEGGIGVIAGAMIGFRENDIAKNPQEADSRALANEIRAVRSKSPQGTGLLGVNIMVALCNFATLVRTSIAEKADIIFSGAGLPLDLPMYIKEAAEKAQDEITTKLAPIISSARALSILAKKWWIGHQSVPDLVILEGPLAGGHLGFKKEDLDLPEMRLECLLPQVLEAIKPYEDKVGHAIPVIAGGGVFSGNDIRCLLEMGAAGVQMGTRFVTTFECDASLAFKNTYIEATHGTSCIISSPVGMPGRAISSPFLEDILQGKKRPLHCIYHCLKTCNPDTAPYCISLALINAQKGNLDRGFAFAGANVDRVCDIVSVKDLIESLHAEYEASGNSHNHSSMEAMVKAEIFSNTTTNNC